MTRIVTWSFVLLAIAGCRPTGNGPLTRRSYSPYVDATRGEKPQACYLGACGTWQTPEQVVGSNAFRVALGFSGNQVSRIVTCRYRDGSVRTAQVVARARVFVNEIEILQTDVARDAGPRGEPDCESSVEQTRVRYELRNGNNVLAILHDDGTQSLWERKD